MSDTERFLREALRRMAEEVGPRQDLPSAALRRTRRRQGFVALAVGIIVVSAGVAGFIGVDALRSTRPTVPASPTPTTPAPRVVPSCVPGWTTAPQPDPPYIDQLWAISGTSWKDIWVVGSRFLEENGDSFPLIEHWDGQAWTVIPGTAEFEGRRGRLAAVQAIAADDVWVVGDTLGRRQDILEHWDGTRWSAVEFPTRRAMGSLDKIVAISSDDVWVLAHAHPVAGPGSISEDVFLHWDGDSWSLVEAPPPVDPYWGTSAIQSIAASGPHDVWGVGGKVQGFSEAGRLAGPLVEHWDGRRWAMADAPSGPDSLGIAVATPDGQLWAATGGYLATVGAYGSGPPGDIYHWNGKSWSLAHRIRTGTVMGLVARSPRDVWAFGETEGGHAFIDHWDGKDWTSPDALATAPPSVSGLLPAAALTVDGTVVAFTADYPHGFGGGDRNPSDQPKNYLWADCSGQ